MEGDDHGEAYTAIIWGMGLSHEILNAGAEAFTLVEGKTSGTAMRGAVALPGSKAISRMKGTRRNLGDPRLTTGLVPAWSASGRRGAEADDARA